MGKGRSFAGPHRGPACIHGCRVSLARGSPHRGPRKEASGAGPPAGHRPPVPRRRPGSPRHARRHPMVGTWRFEIGSRGTSVVRPTWCRAPRGEGCCATTACGMDPRCSLIPGQGQGLVGLRSRERSRSSVVRLQRWVGTGAPDGIPDDAPPSITFYAISISPGGRAPTAAGIHASLVDHDHLCGPRRTGRARRVHLPAIGAKTTSLISRVSRITRFITSS